MIRELIELEQSDWQLLKFEDGPKKLKEVHADLNNITLPNAKASKSMPPTPLKSTGTPNSKSAQKTYYENTMTPPC